MFHTIFSGQWPRKSARNVVSVVTFIVFLFLDFLDIVFCILYKSIDEFFEGKASPCYCCKEGSNLVDDGESEVSETLYGRKNLFRDLGFLGFLRKWEGFKKRGKCVGGGLGMNRWSDCGCQTCVSWMNDGDLKLHIVVKELSEATTENCCGKPTENVIFLHGFLSSSSLWTETVFPNLLKPVKCKYRLFAIDLLGFGRSPKPRDSMYTVRDHLEMIEKSVICPFQLRSFHLVAHSMGCMLGLALAAKYSKFVKSITLLAPPYFPSSEAGASLTALERLAERRLWPPLLFGSSFMSWYEHLGRCVCFLVCRNHRIWEWMLKLLTRKRQGIHFLLLHITRKIIQLPSPFRDLPFTVRDMTRHTHHSAWHTMHNVICGGAKKMDLYFDKLNKAGVKINVIQGNEDQVVPLECSSNVKTKVPDSKISIIPNADHTTVIVGREKDFTEDLVHIWMSADITSKED